MKIENVTISNFRSIIHVNIGFEDLMMFIGQNNHGKSNILYAILFFFGEIKLEDLDFFDGTEELYVEILFKELDENDQVTFKKYLTHDNKILVRKSAYRSGSFQYNGYLNNPIEDFLQEINAKNYKKREIAETLPFYDKLPQSGTIKIDDIIKAQKEYIEENSSELSFNYEMEESNFLGLKSVAQGIFGEVFFIPAVKNINDDLSSNKSSIFTKLYSKVISLITSSDGDIANIKEQVNNQFKKFKKYNENQSINVDRPVELNVFETKLSTNLAEWGVNLEVEVLSPNIDEVFRSSVNIWIHDGIKTDINRKGHGLQRALTFSLIKTLSEQVLEEASLGGQYRQVSKSSYFIFEEPELYLHPQAQKSLLYSLENLSLNSQVVLCTHSSSLISLEKYKSIAIVRKDNETKETNITQYQEEILEEDEKKNFQLVSWINQDRAELFFAKKVILLEGATEKTVIPYIAKKLGIFKYEYTLIDCGSKNNIPSYVKLLEKFKIPYIAVYDKDHQTRKQQDAIDIADRDSQKIEDLIDTGESIIFENDIEEELGMSAGTSSKPFKALQEVSDESFNIPNSFEIKVRKIYE
ncbi:ATP-dependent nuclease [Aliarcobacter cryaerophilus]|uniref:ATP-dependent nuclease n=1 Tax=Aliarcobacter cryaerophilus TaxID=28198 RepID=UPI003DA64144